MYELLEIDLSIAVLICLFNHLKDLLICYVLVDASQEHFKLMLAQLTVAIRVK